MENRNSGEAFINASKLKLAGLLLAASLMVGPAPVEAQEPQPAKPGPGTIQLEPEWTENGVRVHWANGYYGDMNVVNPGVVPNQSFFGKAEGITDPASDTQSIDVPPFAMQLEPAWTTSNEVVIGWSSGVTTAMSLAVPGVVPSESLLGSAVSISDATEQEK